MVAKKLCKMNKITFKNAANITVYCIDDNGVVYERTLLEHVLPSADEVDNNKLFQMVLNLALGQKIINHECPPIGR